MKKFIRKAIVFLVVLILLLVVKKHFTPYYLGDKIFKAKYENFIESQEHYNSIVFGSSRLYRQVNTMLLDSILNDYNFSTYNFSAGGTYNPESYFLYDNFLSNLDSETIKYAFVEIQQLHPYSKNNSKTTKASYWNNIEYLYYSFKYINSSDYEPEQKIELYKSYLSSYFYGLFDFAFLKNVLVPNNIKEIGKNGFYPIEKAMNESGRKNKLEKRWNEFHSDTTVLMNRIASAKIKAESISPGALNKFHLKYLKSLITKSSQKGIHLFYILAPRLREDQYHELIPICNSLPIENTIKLYSYPRFKEFYMVNNSFDIGHLNSRGADIFTEYLANEVKEIKSRTYNNVYSR